MTSTRLCCPICGDELMCLQVGGARVYRVGKHLDCTGWGMTICVEPNIPPELPYYTSVCLDSWRVYRRSSRAIIAHCDDKSEAYLIVDALNEQQEQTNG